METKDLGSIHWFALALRMDCQRLPAIASECLGVAVAVEGRGLVNPHPANA